MKRVISYFILCLCILMLLLSATSCSNEVQKADELNQQGQANQSEQANQTKEATQPNQQGQLDQASQSTQGSLPTQPSQQNQADINAFSSSPKLTGMAHLILYFPDQNNKYLVAQERYINIERSIEETIVNELLKQFNSSKPIRILAITEKGGTLTVNLSGEFEQALKASGNKKNIIIYSFVNSLTELYGVREVRFLVDSHEILGLPSAGTSVNNHNSTIKAYKRDRSYFNRNPKLSPSEVLLKEMTYEQNGQWLKAYQLMSDDQTNKYRKYYNEYYKEMEETKENGFLLTKFNVNGYKLNKTGDKASVEVQFINNINTSYAQVVDKSYFNVVKIQGVWLVDWLTTQ